MTPFPPIHSNRLQTDQRGVSEVIGAILIFGLVLTVLTMFQALAIPATNGELEFAHNQDAQADLHRFAGVTSDVAATGATRTVSIRAGTVYPARLVFFNPPPPSGRVATEQVGTGVISLANATATTPGAAAFFDGSVHRYETRSFVYQPDYNEYDTAPKTIYEHTVLYNEFPSGQTLVTGDGSLISGNRISVVVLSGNLSHQQAGSVPLTIRPISTATESTTITGTAGRNITLTLPTRLSVDAWRDLLADERRTGHVVAVRDAGGDAVTVVLDGSVTYELRVARVGVGQSGTDGATGTPSFLVVEGDTTVDVAPSETRSLVVQVRDQYGNPRSGVTVNASAPTGSLADRHVTTDAGGDARFLYTAPPDATTDRVDVSFVMDPAGVASFDSSTPENVSFAVTVGDGTDGSDTGGDINPNQANAVILTDETIGRTGCGSSPVGCNVTITLNNTHSTAVTVSAVRYNFYAIDLQGNVQSQTPPKYVNFSDDRLLEMRGPFESVGALSLSPGKRTVSMRFFEDQAQTSPYAVGEGDFFILSVRYTRQSGEVFSATYFIAPEAP